MQSFKKIGEGHLPAFPCKYFKKNLLCFIPENLRIFLVLAKKKEVFPDKFSEKRHTARSWYAGKLDSIHNALLYHIYLFISLYLKRLKLYL